MLYPSSLNYCLVSGSWLPDWIFHTGSLFWCPQNMGQMPHTFYHFSPCSCQGPRKHPLLWIFIVPLSCSITSHSLFSTQPGWSLWEENVHLLLKTHKWLPISFTLRPKPIKCLQNPCISSPLPTDMIQLLYLLLIAWWQAQQGVTYWDIVGTM